MVQDAKLTPRQVFEETQKLLLAHDIEGYLEYFAEDAVIESKFTSTGQAHTIEGKAAIAKVLRTSNTASPLERKAFQNTMIHQTDDPKVIIAEYDQLSESKKDGSQHAWSDVLILTVENGKIHKIRTYTNPIAIAQAMGTS